MANYNEIETAYKMNMFKDEANKKQTLAEMFKEVEDKDVTGDDGANLYHLAARFFDAEAVAYLASEGLKPRSNDYGNTPLHTMTNSPYGNDVKNFSKMEEAIYNTAKALIDAGVNPKKKNDMGELAYMKAGKNCMYPYMRVMAEAGIKMDATGREGKNLLHIITDQLYHRKNINGEIENVYQTIKILLDSGSPDPEDKDIFDKDALYYAQRSEVKEIAALLSGNEGDELATKTGGQTLTQAIKNNDLEAIQSLLESGANPDEIEEQERTPLMWACNYPKPEVVKLLLKHGANPNFVVGETGKSAMTYLLTDSILFVNGSPQEIKKMYLTIIRALFDAGLDANSALDPEGNTALIYIARMDYFAGLNNIIAEEILEGGADSNKANLKGQTPLMAFAERGDEQEYGIAELLLDAGADPAPADANSNTALMYAAGNYNKASGKKISELIIESGYTELDRTNNKGETAMDIAVRNQNEALVKLILMNS